jgi:hypothetical protein
VIASLGWPGTSGDYTSLLLARGASRRQATGRDVIGSVTAQQRYVLGSQVFDRAQQEVGRELSRRASNRWIVSHRVRLLAQMSLEAAADQPKASAA